MRKQILGLCLSVLLLGAMGAAYAANDSAEQNEPCTASVRVVQQEGDTILLCYDWSWSNKPFYLGNDLIAVSCQGTDSKSRVLDMKVTQRVEVRYYSKSGELVAADTLADSLYIPMKKKQDGQTAWAKEGTVTLTATAKGLKSMKFALTYGHQPMWSQAIALDEQQPDSPFSQASKVQAMACARGKATVDGKLTMDQLGSTEGYHPEWYYLVSRMLGGLCALLLLALLLTAACSAAYGKRNRSLLMRLMKIEAAAVLVLFAAQLLVLTAAA